MCCECRRQRECGDHECDVPPPRIKQANRFAETTLELQREAESLLELEREAERIQSLVRQLQCEDTWRD